VFRFGSETARIRSKNGTDENCTILGHYRASSRHSLQTFRDKLSVPSLRVKNLLGFLVLKDGTCIRNYQYSLRNNPGERSILPCGGSLKSSKEWKTRGPEIRWKSVSIRLCVMPHINTYSAIMPQDRVKVVTFCDAMINISSHKSP